PCRGSDETQFMHILTKNIAVMETEISRQMWEDLRVVQPTLPEDPSSTSASPLMINPVQRNNWYESVLFANLLSVQNGYTQCYHKDATYTIPVDATNYTTGQFFWNAAANGYRLPSEGEWEHFCRAGTNGPFSCDEQLYDAGNCYSCVIGTHDVLEDYCVYCANDPGSTQAVGSKLSNPWNLKDVHGNVWEWCWDWYGDYPTGLEEDYTGPMTGSDRVKHGGSWENYARGCRSAKRSSGSPGWHFDSTTGFRLVRTVN
ncbi:formylglycine-generating enzyme family protein, partial [bacterium]|nr:formylglycine-generating enzyme family protein [candidate division CSSED10-310 bacterium]